MSCKSISDNIVASSMLTHKSSKIHDHHTSIEHEKPNYKKKPERSNKPFTLYGISAEPGPRATCNGHKPCMPMHPDSFRQGLASLISIASQMQSHILMQMKAHMNKCVTRLHNACIGTLHTKTHRHRHWLSRLMRSHCFN